MLSAQQFIVHLLLPVPSAHTYSWQHRSVLKGGKGSLDEISAAGKILAVSSTALIGSISAQIFYLTGLVHLRPRKHTTALQSSSGRLILGEERSGEDVVKQEACGHDRMERGQGKGTATPRTSFSRSGPSDTKLPSARMMASSFCLAASILVAKRNEDAYTQRS